MDTNTQNPEDQELAQLEDLMKEVGEVDTDLAVHMDRANEDKMEGYEGEDDASDGLPEADLEGEETHHKFRLARIKSRYKDLTKPDHFHFEITPPLTREDFAKGSVSKNDYYLDKYNPIIPFARSIAKTAQQFEGWKMVPGVDSKTTERTEYMQLYRPKSAATDGGKGMTYYTEPVIATTAGMSTIVNVIIASSCPANCSFCLPINSEVNKVTGKKSALSVASLFEKELGFEIKSHDGWVKVKKHFWNGMKECFRYTLSDGTEIECTENHKFATEENGVKKYLSIDEILDRKLPLLKCTQKRLLLSRKEKK